MDIVPNTSKELLFLRKKLGLNQYQMGVNRGAYQHYERGERNPSREQLFLIATNLIEKYFEKDIFDKETEQKILNLFKLAKSDIFWDKIKEIKERHKKDQAEQARQTMALYKKKGVSPFFGFVVLLVQFPIIIALYFVFLKGGLPILDRDILYTFIREPEVINMHFLGLMDMGAKSYLLALVAGVTQYFQTKLSMPPMKPREKNSSFKEDMLRSFGIQMRYVMPIIVIVFAYIFNAAVALYWTTSNCFSIVHELIVKRQAKTL
jgi:YidC/Oxa1 family membrane protein insertase